MPERKPLMDEETKQRIKNNAPFVGYGIGHALGELQINKTPSLKPIAIPLTIGAGLAGRSTAKLLTGEGFLDKDELSISAGIASGATSSKLYDSISKRIKPGVTVNPLSKAIVAGVTGTAATVAAYKALKKKEDKQKVDEAAMYGGFAPQEDVGAYIQDTGVKMASSIGAALDVVMTKFAGDKKNVTSSQYQAALEVKAAIKNKQNALANVAKQPKVGLSDLMKMKPAKAEAR